MGGVPRSCERKHAPSSGRCAVLAPTVTRAVIEGLARRPEPASLGELTPREREVFGLLVRGMSNPEICQELVVSEATARTHVARILQKLRLRDRVQAVIYAYEAGLAGRGDGLAAPPGNHRRADRAREAEAATTPSVGEPVRSRPRCSASR